MNHPNGKNRPVPPPPKPGFENPQAAPPPMTIDQLIAEGHARGRRMSGDLVFYGNLVDQLVQEIVARQNTIQELREALDALKAELDNLKAEIEAAKLVEAPASATP